jgi:hypothetical protein
MITAVEFTTRYIEWLEEIDQVINDKYYPAIRVMYCTDPHDLISPVACFVSEEHAIGFIWKSLVMTHKQRLKENANATA